MIYVDAINLWIVLFRLWPFIEFAHFEWGIFFPFSPTLKEGKEGERRNEKKRERKNEKDININGHCGMMEEGLDLHLPAEKKYRFYLYLIFCSKNKIFSVFYSKTWLTGKFSKILSKMSLRPIKRKSRFSHKALNFFLFLANFLSLSSVAGQT